MDLINISFPKNYIWTGLSIAGLGLLTYATNKYNSNTKATTNQTYLKSSEIINSQYNNNVLLSRNNIAINYVFWNGDMASTYLIIDLLIQDKLVQPLYIERYTIAKNLEKERLQTLLNKKSNGQTFNPANTQFLKELNQLKTSQTTELKDLEVLRLMILKQLPEFKTRFLPTVYITTIEKDLEYTTRFYDAVKSSGEQHVNGIELIEQISRFIKYYKPFDQKHLPLPRIILATTKDYKNYILLAKLAKAGNIIPEISLPLITKTNEQVKYMATEFLPNDINMYFIKSEKIKDNNSIKNFKSSRV
jgi:hypothetical protein